ncbi:ATP-binding protein, partial [Azospirillum sp. A39]
ANRLPLAARLAAALAARHPPAGPRGGDLELALHEAVANAIIHGNLQVESVQDAGVAALDRFSAALAARLADPAFAGRRVVVRAWLEARGVVVEVADDGAGFTAPPPRHPAAAAGRGLALIGAVASAHELLDGGRRIRMRFAL